MRPNLPKVPAQEKVNPLAKKGKINVETSSDESAIERCGKQNLSSMSLEGKKQLKGGDFVVVSYNKNQCAGLIFK